MFKKGMLTALMLLMTVICFGCNADENPAREFANSHSSSENASELETISPTIRGQNEEITKVAPEVISEGDVVAVVSPTVFVEEPEEDKPIFIPDIIDKDEFVDLVDKGDYSKVYDYTNASLTTCWGNMTVSEGIYTSTTAGAIMANKDSSTPFPYGTISADVMNNGSDTGIIFGLTANASSFWEGAGITYYFYFVSQGGTAYLGKADNGTWSVLGQHTIENFSAQATYNIQVIYKESRVLCYLDGECVLGFLSSSLPGTGWGLRAGASGAVISNIQISSSVEVK